MRSRDWRDLGGFSITRSLLDYRRILILLGVIVIYWLRELLYRKSLELFVLICLGQRLLLSRQKLNSTLGILLRKIAREIRMLKSKRR